MPVSDSSRSTSELAPEGTTKKNFRPDIQGLRALAVVAVILDHLLGWPSGGFVGVDVFFVISGFLITGLLLREHEQTGTISWVGFYRRRIKRIIPVSTLVIVATVVLSFVVFNLGRATQTVWDGLWSLFFAANWNFATQGTDYFQADGLTSPLQHYWSLAVEEQFYFVWPWLMLLILTTAGRRGWNTARAHRVAGLSMAAIIIASFALAIIQTATNPTAAYFSTFTRAWELGLGALIAVAAPVFAALPRWMRPILGWIGLLGISVSLFIVSDEVAFPAPWAALPVVATAIVIIAGTGGEQRFLAPLTNRVSVYLGDISFSLYLWHFPIIILLGSLAPDAGVTYSWIVLLLTVAVSAISYYWVEDRIRKSSWLERLTPEQKRRDARERRRRNRRPTGNGRYVVVGLAAIAATTLAVVALSPRADISTFTAPASGAVVPSPSQAPNGGNGLEQQVENEISAALATTSWPELSPGVNSLLDDTRPDEDSAGCGRTNIDNPDACSFGEPSLPSIVVFGDSTGITLLPTVRAAYGDTHHIRGLTMASCVAIDVDVAFVSADIEEACLEHRSRALQEVQALRPEIVFVIDSYTAGASLASGAEGVRLTEEWSTGLQSTIDQISGSATHVIIVAPAPRGKLLEECATPFSSPHDCVSDVPQLHSLVRDAEERAQGDNVRYVDTISWFCNSEGSCPSFAGVTPIKRDGVHTTKQWAVRVAPLFREQTDAAIANGR